MADIALMPKGDVLERGDSIAAKHASQAAEPLPGDRVALVRHRARPFLTFRKEFFGLEDFGPLEVAELGRPALDAGCDQGQGANELGMDVALDHLSGNRGWTQAQFLANGGLDLR